MRGCTTTWFQSSRGDKCKTFSGIIDSSSTITPAAAAAVVVVESSKLAPDAPDATDVPVAPAVAAPLEWVAKSFVIVPGS